MLQDIAARSLVLLPAAGEFIRNLRGFRRFLLCFASGLLSALAFEPVNAFFFLLFGFAILALLIDGAQGYRKPVRSAAVAGWVFGFGHFLAGFYWIGYAFMVEPEMHAWQLPLVALLFPGGLAIFPAAASALAAALWRGGIPRLFIFSASYGVAEWLRGHILTGFPWNIPAYAWGGSLSVLQSVSVVGVYGLSLLTILLGAMLSVVVSARLRREWPWLAGLAALFLILLIGGHTRLDSTPQNSVAGVRLRIVQPDVAQAEKYVPRLIASHWRDLVLMSLQKHGPPPTHIIWPEAAPPFLLSREPGALDDIAVLTSGAHVLMTGAVRGELSPGKQPLFFNSFYIFAHGGAVVATYDKFHLVPFGEYLPLEPLLKFLGITKLVGLPGSFSAGDGPHTYSVPGAPPVGPLICYEILFPGAVTAANRPGWFANTTDDSWFGPPGSSGPVQHFLIARTRAIEEGIPVVRAANTGISAVIDPVGRVVAELGAGKKGVLDSTLPLALPPTLYSRWGDLAFWFFVFVCAIFGFWVNRAPRDETHRHT